MPRRDTLRIMIYQLRTSTDDGTQDTHIERGLSCNHRGVAFAFVMAWPWGRGVAKLACGGDDDGDHDSTLIGSLMSHTRRREKKRKRGSISVDSYLLPLFAYI
jgi:hypothetical protein